MAWTPVTISKKVGPGLDNNEDDVKNIQTLLNSVRIGPKLQVNGIYDKDTSTAIGSFQKIWGGANYRIEPGGTWLQRLNDTAKPLTIKNISLIRINEGGYSITYEGFVPPKGYRVMLYYPASFSQIPSDAIDITRKGLTNKPVTINLRTDDTLLQLLKLIASKGAWGSPLAFNIYLVCDEGYVVSVSNSINIRTPVKPYDGSIKLNMAHFDDRPMFYVGELDNSIPSGVRGMGRWLSEVIGGRRYFAYAGDRFETYPDKRGFDCTTYAGTILGLRPPGRSARGDVGQMNGNGLDVANLIGAEVCEFEFAPGKKKMMENIDLSMMKYFFTNNSTGAFIMWTSGHVMLVVDNIVHEFTIPIGSPGYKQRGVLNERPWLVPGMKFSIRKIPSGRLKT